MRNEVRKAIEDIVVGDHVWAWDEENGEKPLAAFVQEYMKIAKYDFDFGGQMINKIMSPGFKIFSAWL